MTARIRELKFETAIVAGSLLSISAASWVLSTYHFTAESMTMGGMFQLDMVSILLFVGSWTFGMMAMMFPTIVPMTLAIFRAGRNASKDIKAGGGPTITKAFAFASAYISLWVGFGVALYLGIILLSSMTGLVEFPTLYLRFFPALIVLGSGIYQFAPLKGECLNRCHPTTFLLRNYRGGITGSALMGGSYGVFCIGCCWVLMINLLLIGAMSITWMGLFAIAILVERITPERWQVSKIVGTILIVLGLWLSYQAS